MSKVNHSEHGAKFVKGAAILSITGIIAKVLAPSSEFRLITGLVRPECRITALLIRFIRSF